MGKKSKWIIGGAGVILIAAGACYSFMRGVDAEVAVAAKGDIRQFIEDTAVVKSRGSQTVYIEGTGRITEVKVETGDTVLQGDLILSLDKTDLQLQLRDAEANVAASRAQLKGTETISYANRIEMARAAVEQAEVAYETALRDYENSKLLYDAGALSKEELNRAEAAQKTAAAALSSAKLELEEIKAGAADYVKEAYRAQLEQAIVYRDTIRENLKRQEIRAPLSGTIIEKHVEVNSMAVPGTPAFVIGDPKALELEANILADDAVRIAVGCDVEISGKVTGNKVLRGRVSKVAPAAQNVTSSLGVNQKRVPVTIELVESSDTLKPGYNVDIKIITAAGKDILQVPDSAVFEYKDADYVFVVEQGKAVLRKVTKGIEGEDFVEITEGLKEGEQVLVKPDNNIKEGTRIRYLPYGG